MCFYEVTGEIWEKSVLMLMERKKGRDIEGFQATLYTKENQTGNAQRTYHTYAAPRKGPNNKSE